MKHKYIDIAENPLIKVRVRRCWKCRCEMAVGDIAYYCQNQKCPEYDIDQRAIYDEDVVEERNIEE